MLKSNEPFKSIFKVLRLLGLSHREIKTYHKSLAILIFVVFGLGFWIPLTMSVLQAKDRADFIERVCSSVSTVIVYLEVIVFFSKMEPAIDLLKRIERILKKNRWENAFHVAQTTSLRLVLFHSVVSTVALVAAAGCSIHGDGFMHNVYYFEFMKKDAFFEITWIYYACGSIYTHIFSLTLELFPVIVMIFIPELLQALNDEFRKINVAAIGSKILICEWVDMHQEVIE